MQMLKLIPAYLIAVFLSWVTWVGVLFTLAAIVFIVVLIPAEQQRFWFVVITIFCLIVAPYHAWVKEHLRAEKYSTPEANAAYNTSVKAEEERLSHQNDAYKTRK